MPEKNTDRTSIGEKSVNPVESAWLADFKPMHMCRKQPDDSYYCVILL